MIRAQASLEAEHLIADPFWAAGVALYWGEGSKTRNKLEVANSDPGILRLFINWVRAYLDPRAEFVLHINLHADNSEPLAKAFWAAALLLPEAEFHKTFVKPDGTGHRKNHLPHGVCRVKVRRAADQWQTTMAWIEWLGPRLGQ